MESEKKPLKVGPFGSDNGGERFDDGVHSTVRQLVICYDSSSIRYIQIEYDDNGDSIWSCKHGYSNAFSDDKINTVKLDYPDEYLTSVHGYYTGGWLSPSYITSLTFTSNRKVYGTFGSSSGNEGRKYFSIQASGSKIVGFHGRSSNWFDLRAIGAYLKPVVIPTQKLNPNPSGFNHAPPMMTQVGYPAGNYNYGHYNHNYPPQAPHPAPTPYGYNNYYVPPPPPPGPPPFFNNGYPGNYGFSQAPRLAVGRPSKPKSAAKIGGPKNVSHEVLDNQCSGNTGDHNGVFNVGNKNTGRNRKDDDDDSDEDDE